MNTWYTSDWHFNHDKPFIYAARGFSSIDEMNEAIVERHNKLVKEDDIVYCLGDCFFLRDGNADNSIKLINRLKGDIYLIRGNHDTDAKVNKMVMECKNLKLVLGNYYFPVKISKTKHFYLAHFPTICSNQHDKIKLISIHGHTHSSDKFEFTDSFLSYNVAMDAHNCYPISQEEIIADLKNYMIGHN